MGKIHSFQEVSPKVAPTAWLASGVQLIGNVSVGERASVWFNSVLRADICSISVGDETNIQDLSVCHVDFKQPLILGNRVTVGHKCLLHSCFVEDDCLIGMGAILMNEVHVSKGTIIGAGALVLEKTFIPPYSLVVGSPAKVKKTYDPSIIETIRESASHYAELAQCYSLEH